MFLAHSGLSLSLLLLPRSFVVHRQNKFFCLWKGEIVLGENFGENRKKYIYRYSTNHGTELNATSKKNINKAECYYFSFSTWLGRVADLGPDEVVVRLGGPPVLL